MSNQRRLLPGAAVASAGAAAEASRAVAAAAAAAATAAVAPVAAAAAPAAPACASAMARPVLRRAARSLSEAAARIPGRGVHAGMVPCWWDGGVPGSQVTRNDVAVGAGAAAFSGAAAAAAVVAALQAAYHVVVAVTMPRLAV
eukprot:350874-Chlamydomonas_euryale.AAC.19